MSGGAAGVSEGKSAEQNRASAFDLLGSISNAKRRLNYQLYRQKGLHSNEKTQLDLVHRTLGELKFER